MDQPKMERLLRLMQALIANDRYTIEDLAEKLNMSVRTIYRYIDSFKAAGFVVQKKDDCFILSKESSYFKDISELVHFTDEEACIVNRLIENLDNNNELKQNLKRKLATVYNVTAMAESVVRNKNAKIVNRLVEAIQQKKKVILCDYASKTTGLRDRVVEPFQFTANYVQLLSFDTESKECKFFKISRIGDVDVLDEDWEFEDLHVNSKIDVFRMQVVEEFPVKMQLDLYAYWLLIEEYPLAEKCCKKINDRKYLFEATVGNYAGAARFYLGLSDHIKIIKSKSFEEYIQKFVRKNLKKFC